MILTDTRKLTVRAAVNDWIGRNFLEHRSLIAHNQPTYSPDNNAWAVELVTKRNGGPSYPLGCLLVSDAAAIISAPEVDSVLDALDTHQSEPARPTVNRAAGDGWELYLGDGIEAAARLADRSVDLLLTDPPYGISRRYTCENQIPRRLRRDGSDFIMPRGYFGDWDTGVDPQAWTSIVLPKVRGWAVTFCAQAQIGEYCDLLTAHGFVAVGPMVWQKTNPVPFNHQHKPINAWEALVVGKRSGTAYTSTKVGELEILHATVRKGLHLGPSISGGCAHAIQGRSPVVCPHPTRLLEWRRPVLRPVRALRSWVPTVQVRGQPQVRPAGSG